MKKIKILLLLLTVSVAGFYSCTDNDPVENEVVTTKSISLRTTLNEIKKQNNISGKNSFTALNQTPCFNFVFPINLSYNNGTVISVSSLSGLLTILTGETNNLYIEGIEFPFQVQTGTTVTTITNEAAFFTLIQGCNFYTLNDTVFDFTCYEIVYPISIVNASNQTVTINNQEALLNLVTNQNGTTITYQLNIVFPISVILDNQTITINNLYEFFTLNNDCASSDCVCPAVFDPVCVNDPINFITLTFANACQAECAGYTAADFVNCNGTTPINFGTALGTCFTMNYPVQIQHQGAVLTMQQNGQLLQYYFPNQSPIPAFVYPLVVNFNTAGGSVAVTVSNQAAFEAAIAANCN